jgi:hypothetical protein
MICSTTHINPLTIQSIQSGEVKRKVVNRWLLPEHFQEAIVFPAIRGSPSLLLKIVSAISLPTLEIQRKKPA